MTACTNWAMAIVLLPILLGVGGYSSKQKMSFSQAAKYSFPNPGPCRIHGKAPKGFETFYEFEWELLPGDNASALKVDENGKINIAGALFVRPSEFRPGTQTEPRGEITASEQLVSHDVVRLNFKSATFQLEGNRFAVLDFETEPVDETYYVLHGTFLAQPPLQNGMYVHLVAKTTKIKRGRKEAEAVLKFVRAAYE